MKAFLFLLLLLTTSIAWGQTYFNNRYAVSPIFSGATTLAFTTSGYVTAGQSWDSLNRPGYNLLLTFVDSTGQLQRARAYHRTGTHLYPGVDGALLNARTGGLALIGSCQDTLDHGMLWRFSARGDSLWSRTYSNAFGLILYNGVEVANGDFLLNGLLAVDTTRGASNLVDAVLIRTDSLGNEKWRRTYHQSWYDVVNYVLPTPDGGALLSGAALDRSLPTYTPSDCLIIKVDSLGQGQWQHTYGTADRDGAGEALSAPGGGYWVGVSWGAPKQGGTPVYRPGLLKLDASGQQQSLRTYGRALPIEGHLRAVPGGGFVLWGQAKDSLRGKPLGHILRLCENGDSLWYHTYKFATGPQSQNYLRDVRPTPDGGFVGCGFFFPNPPDTGPEAVWLFKTDQYGYLQPGQPAPTTTCVLGVDEESPPAAEAVSVFPNPSADGRFTVRVDRAATLTVSDALGRLVLRRETAVAETALDLSQQPAGVYVLRIAWPDGRTITKKLLR